MHMNAQELFVSTEPASNMAAGSISLRLNTKVFGMKYENIHTIRFNPEIMIGVSKKLMVHANLYSSDFYQPQLKFEGTGVYAKYRFYSADDVQTHFRMAAFGKISFINNPEQIKVDNKFYNTDESDLDGNNSGIMAGIVATQLLHKLALSLSVAFENRWNNLDAMKLPSQNSQAVNYTLSAGYLLLPRVYTNYHQTNFNLYCEVLGSSSLDKKSYYIDVAPAVQFIFNSISRLDFSCRTQLIGNMQRLTSNGFLIRFEYNFLNVFKNR